MADDGGGDLVCLDYRRGADVPGVVYWSHEVGGADGVPPLADTFAEFLAFLGSSDAD